MTLVLNIKNESNIKKIKEFVNELNGVEIIQNYVDDSEMNEILNDKELYDSLKNALKEVENKEYNFV